MRSRKMNFGNLVRKRTHRFSPRFSTESSRHMKDKGLTLLGLLVVVVIIGLLAGYIAPRYFSQIGKSEVQAARAQIDAFD